MTDIAAIGGRVAGRIDPSVRTGRQTDAPIEDTRSDASRPARGTDRVEVSRMAQYLRQLSDLPAIRVELVARVRDQIDSGVYDTPTKLQSALDELIDEHAAR